MPTYRYAIGDHAIGPIWGMDPFTPSLTFYLSGQPHEFTCTIDGLSPAGLNLQELVQDVWVWRDGDLIFRGPLIGCADTLDGNSHMVALTAHSYRERLAHWPIPNNAPGSTTTLFPLGTATPVGLGWLAINLTRPTSDLATILVDKHVASGTSTAQSAQSGTATDAAIDNITQVTPYDWDLIPNDATGQIEYHTYAPTRGAAHPEYVLLVGKPGTGGANCTLTRTFDLSTFGNEVWMTGQDAAGANVFAISPTTRSYGPEGLWIVSTASTVNATTGASTLQTQANTQLTKSSTPQAAYTLTVAEGWWPGPDLLWLGDAPTLVIKSGRLNVQSAARIQQIVIQPADGAEKVQLTVGAKPIGKAGEFALARTLAGIAKRLRAVEWNQ